MPWIAVQKFHGNQKLDFIYRQSMIPSSPKKCNKDKNAMKGYLEITIIIIKYIHTYFRIYNLNCSIFFLFRPSHTRTHTLRKTGSNKLDREMVEFL